MTALASSRINVSYHRGGDFGGRKSPGLLYSALTIL